jgi:hypothetical protein
MKQLIDADLLRQCGLGADAAFEQEFVARPPSDVGEAAGREWLASLSLAALLQVGPGALHFEPARSALAEAQGVTLEAARDVPGVYRLAAGAGVRVDVVRGGDPGVGYERSAHDPGVVTWDGRAAPTFLVIVDGRPVGFRASADGIHVEVAGADVRIDAFEEVRAPLDAWARTTADAWLGGELMLHRDVGTTWAHATGAGMDARLQRVEEGTATARARRVLAGDVGDELTRARRWARALSAEQARTLEDLAMAEADALEVALHALAGSNVTDSEHALRWLDACHRRDDLAGVLVLLGETGGGGRLHAVLEDIDRLGAQVRLDMPAELGASDERLRRVAARQPYAWWAAHMPESHP